MASPKGDELTGPLAEAGLRHFRARKAFIGAAGVTMDGTFNSNVLRGSVDATIVGQSTEVYVLADHTKIGRVSLVSVIGLDQVSAIVTDGPVREADGQWLSKANVRVIVPDGAAASAKELEAADEEA